MKTFFAVCLVALSGCAGVDTMFRGSPLGEPAFAACCTAPVPTKPTRTEFQAVGPVTPKTVARTSSSPAPLAMIQVPVPVAKLEPKAPTTCKVKDTTFSGDECKLVARIKAGEVVPFPAYSTEAVVIDMVCDAMDGRMDEVALKGEARAHYFRADGGKLKFLCVKDVTTVPTMEQKEGYFARKPPAGIANGSNGNGRPRVTTGRR